MYSQIIEDTKRKIDDCISSTSIARAYSSIFHAILRLRLLCNQGTHRLLDSKSEDRNGHVEVAFVEGSMLTCHFCSCEIIAADARNDVSPGTSPQNSLHLLCPACLSPPAFDKTGYQRRPKSSRGAKRIDMTENGCPQPNGPSSNSLRANSSRQGQSSKMFALNE